VRSRLSSPKSIFVLGLSTGVLLSILVSSIVWLALSSPKYAVTIESTAVGLAAAAGVVRLVLARFVAQDHDETVAFTTPSAQPSSTIGAGHELD